MVAHGARDRLEVQLAGPPTQHWNPEVGRTWRVNLRCTGPGDLVLVLGYEGSRGDPGA